MKTKLFAALVLLPAAIFAQETRGTISGTVTDAQGGAVPKASVVATELTTGTKATAVTGDAGTYTIPFLAQGVYQIVADTPGFKQAVRKGVTLDAGGHPVVDLKLEVGATSESVTITADVPMIESANASIGQTVTTEEVEDLPVNGRTPMMLANLAMGVISTFEPGPVRPFDNSAPTSISMGGAPAGTNESLINGSPNAGFGNAMAYSPPQDAVTQVRANAFESDASYGHTGGGVVNVITKSGTNALHGAIYEFNQTSFLDANSFFTNRAGNPRPPYHYNQYGAVVSGPVMLPKIWDGRNKMFWMFSYEGLRDSDPANSPLETGSPVNYATVPTAAERGGDFSGLLKAGSIYTIYDPNTGVLNGTTISRQPFAGNVIPSSRLNPVSTALLQFLPMPNQPGAGNGLGNFAVNAVDTDGYDNELGRLDYNISDRQRISIDAHHNYRVQDKNNYFGNTATGNILYRINQGAGIDDVYTISPTMVLDVRGSWMRYIEVHASPNDGFDLTSIGLPGSLASQVESKQLPYITFTSTSVSNGGESSFQNLGYNGDGSNIYDAFQFFTTLSKSLGTHTLKVGTDLRQYRWSAYNAGTPSGSFTFTNSSWTNGPNSTSAAAPLGQDLAAFLLGLPNSGSVTYNAQSTTQSKYMSFFVQDDWRVRGNLTVNLGLRFEHETPTTERYNRATNGFDPTATNTASAAAAAAYAANPVLSAYIPANQFKALGGLTFPSSNNPYLYDTTSNIFSPRVGVAWTPAKLGGKTVIRAGFGVFVFPIEIIGNGETGSAVTLNQQGFSQTTTYTSSSNNNLTPATTFSNPFPGGVLLPTGSSQGASTFLGQAVTFLSPTIRNPYSLRWNLSLQRELPGQVVLEVAYIGNHSIHLPVTTNLNYIPRQYLSTSVVRDAADNTVINFLGGTVTNPLKGLVPNGGTLNGATVAAQQLLLPYPQFPLNGVTLQDNGAGESSYESFNVRVQKRLSNNLTFINNFIWNRLTDRLAYLNDSDPAPEARISSDSRPLREVLAAVYELPIGRGRKINFKSKILDSVVGGWVMNGNMVFQSGPPISFSTYIPYAGGPINLNAHQPNGQALNAAAFAGCTAYSIPLPSSTACSSTIQPSDIIRTLDLQFNNLRRDPTKNLDVSMLKKFVFTESGKTYLQFRFEAFNVTNRVTFGAPQVAPTNALFGQISTQANTPRRIQTGLRLVW
jgi:hypothetical protein